MGGDDVWVTGVLGEDVVDGGVGVEYRVLMTRGRRGGGRRAKEGLCQIMSGCDDYVGG
jgi:hypothetical protein